MKKIFSLLLALVMVCSLSVCAFAAPVDEATIDMSRTGNIDLWKYDLTNAEKDGLWDSSYVSTGVRDVNGVESVLGDAERLSPLNENGTAYGYALKGVEFTYLKVADIRTYTESEDGMEHVEVLYGFVKNNALLTAIGVTADDRYAPADQKIGGVQYYYFQSDVLIDALKASLENNATVVKNALENYALNGGGTKLAETDAYGHTEAKDLPLGLYLFVETKVPEMVTETTAPFLVSVPMTSVNGTNANDGGTRWIYDIALYPKNLTGIPTLEKTLRETMADTGKNNGSATDINDGYAHTGTASDGDVIDYQIISTLPSITSGSTYLSEYSFVDTLSSGLSYNGGDVVLTFFRDAACQNKVTTWKEEDGKFRVTYNTASNGDNVMTIEMTNDGLNEINTSRSVYTGVHMVNSGYSDCTLRITYTATMNADDNVPNFNISKAELAQSIQDICEYYAFDTYPDLLMNIGVAEFLELDGIDEVTIPPMVRKIKHLMRDAGTFDIPPIRMPVCCCVRENIVGDEEPDELSWAEQDKLLDEPDDECEYDDNMGEFQPPEYTGGLFHSW